MAHEVNVRDLNYIPTVSGVTNDGNAYITVFKFNAAQTHLLVEATLAAASVNIGDVDIFSNTAKDGSGTRYQPIVDADGHLQVDILSGGGSVTQYTENDVDASITGIAIMWEGGGNTLLPVNTDNPLPVEFVNTTIAITTADPLRVQPVDSSNNIAVVTDDGPFSVGNHGVHAVGFYFDNVATDSVDEGDMGAARMSANRNIFINIRDNAGNERGLNIDANGELGIGAIRSALPAGTNYVGKVRLTDGTTDAEVVPLTGYNAQAVAIVDSNGDQISSFGGGTQYTEDAAAAANPVGTALILVRADTPAGVVTTDGDNVAQRGTNYGAAYVQIVSSAGAFIDSFGGGTQYTEADTDASITGTAMMMEGAANALVPAQGTAADGLLVNLGTNNDVTLTGGGGVIIKDDTVYGEDVTTGILSVAIRLWDGAAYDRLPGNSTDGMLVNLGANNDVTVTGAALTALQLIDDTVYVDDAAFTLGTGKINAVGGSVVAYGSNPDEADAADAAVFLMNRHRMQHVSLGHPNLITFEAAYTAAQTNTAIVSVSTGTKIVVVGLSVTADNANTVDVGYRIGFATATTPTTTDVIQSHPGLSAGSGQVDDVLWLPGGDDEDVRITSEVPTTGSIRVVLRYFTIST